MTRFTESTVEAAALEWLDALGWHVAHGPDIAPYADTSERADYTEVVLEHRLRDTLLPQLVSGAIRVPAANRETAR